MSKVSAGDRRVRHEVDGQCGDIGRADDARIGSVVRELLATRVRSPRSAADSGVSTNPAAISAHGLDPFTGGC